MKIRLPETTSQEPEAIRKNVDYLADHAMPARRATSKTPPSGGVDGDEHWCFTDGSLFLYRRFNGRWFRLPMEEV